MSHNLSHIWSVRNNAYPTLDLHNIVQWIWSGIHTICIFLITFFNIGWKLSYFIVSTASCPFNQWWRDRSSVFPYQAPTPGYTTCPPPSDIPHTMPHICGPHTNLPNCRHNDTRRFEQPGTTWVPIPIHKVQEIGDGQGAKSFNSPSFAPSYAPSYSTPSFAPPSFATPSFAPSSNQGLLRECHPSTRVNNIPIQLSSPGLIMKNKEAGKDDLFPRKKKS